MNTSELSSRVKKSLMELFAERGLVDVKMERFEDVLENDAWRLVLTLAGNDRYWERDNVNVLREGARNAFEEILSGTDSWLPGMNVVELAEKADDHQDEALEVAPEPGEGLVADSMQGETRWGSPR
ncbi:hypothetical protein [Micrococcus aloeverae]